MTTVFSVASLEADYAFLDDCPDILLDAVVALPIGTLPERVAGVNAWRNALLKGQLPTPEAWPPPEIAAPVRLGLEELGIARYCRDQPELVDQLLLEILAAFGRSTDTFRGEVTERLRALEKLERQRLREAEEAERDRLSGNGELDQATKDRLAELAHQEAARLLRAADAQLTAAWQARVRMWAEVSDVFGDLGDLLGRGWDLTTGVLRHVGWRDLVRLHELMKQLPQLREIVASLGRLQLSDQELSVAEKVLTPVRRLEEERREVRTPRVPTETRGVEKSGEIALMLPVEAALLGHPTLRYLWHARRAERALLTYRREGIDFEKILVGREGQEEQERRTPRPNRGPILVVVDTSGSMHGLPERVAKAFALEALRTAHAEKRQCFLYLYSGPGAVQEHELSFSAEGLGQLLTFLGITFGGGNDETGVLRRVIKRLQEAAWKRADVVMLSDGEWPAPTALLEAVAQAKEGGTRFHGVQIGNVGRTGLHSFCDPVHVFRDWVAAGGGHAG